MQNSSEQYIEEWKTDLILEIARRKGFRREALEDACQQLAIVVLKFKYDAAHSSQAAERTALTSIIENQLNMMLRSECRRKKYDKIIQRVCGPSQYESFTCDDHMEHERRFALGMDVRAAVSKLSTLDQVICLALSRGTPRSEIATDLGTSRYVIDRIIEKLADQFAKAGLDSI